MQQLISDRPWARWTALVLLALAMFFAYMFVDVLSPLQSSLQVAKGWDPTAYGRFAGSETFLNVFVFFLIFAGIILDKMGVRFTAILSGAVMVVGAFINFWALTDMFEGSALQRGLDSFINLPDTWWNITPFYKGMPASAKLSAIGFMIFGCGTEMAGITVSRGIVKWFEGKEMALAMGIEMALARIGVAVVFIGSPFFALLGGKLSVARPVGLVVCLLCIGLISFITYSFMDRRLEREAGNTEQKDDPFKVSDLRYIFSSQVFWLVALLCVLYYSAIFPFQKYAANMLQCNLGISVEGAGMIFACFPLGAAAITPFLGRYLDRKGKGATMLIGGALLMIVCHLTFALGLPALRGNDLETVAEDSIVTATVTETDPEDASRRIVSDVVFSPRNFSDPDQQAMVVGRRHGDVFGFNPRRAFFDPQEPSIEKNREKSAERLVSLLSDKNTEITYADALKIDKDFQVQVNKIQAPSGVEGMVVAFLAIVLLGISFSLVPASLWPSVPKLVDPKLLGSAYAVIFWIQNIGLYAFPMIIGAVLVRANPGVNNPLSYNYTWPMLIFVLLGVLALLFGLWLKALDHKRHYGLELPNMKSSQEEEIDGSV